MPRWLDWFVYRAECAPIGPLKTEEIVDAILAGRLSPQAWIARAGGSQWRAAMTIPEIAKLVDGMPTRRHDSRMRMVRSTSSVPPAADPRLPLPGVSPSEPPPATVPPVTAEESAATERTPAVRGPDGFPLPPPSSSPTPTSPPYVPGGGDTLESIPSPSSSRKAMGGRNS